MITSGTTQESTKIPSLRPPWSVVNLLFFSFFFLVLPSSSIRTTYTIYHAFVAHLHLHGGVCLQFGFSGHGRRFFGVSWFFSWVQAAWDGWDYDAIYWGNWECEM